MMPRTGAFEVSYKGYVSELMRMLNPFQLVFSKLGGGYWPNVELVSNKCATIAYHEPHKCDFSGYLAGMSPDRAGFCSPSKSKITNRLDIKLHNIRLSTKELYRI